MLLVDMLNVVMLGVAFFTFMLGVTFQKVISILGVAFLLLC